METLKHAHVDQWGKTIDEGVSQLTSIQSDLEGIADVLDQSGMNETVNLAFQKIHQGASDLQDQIALIEDQIEEIETDPDCEIIRLSDGKFEIVAPKGN
jgi:hypothetical protein